MNALQSVARRAVPCLAHLTELLLGTVKGMYPAVPDADRLTPVMLPETLSTVAVRTAPELSSSS